MVIIRPFRRWRGQPLEPAPAPRTWAGVALIMVGLALAVQLGSGSAQLVPIAILLVSVAVLSLYLVGVNNASRRYDPAQMIVYVLRLRLGVRPGRLVAGRSGQPAAVDLSADFVAVLAMYSIFVIALASGVAFFAYPYVTPTNVAAVYSLQVVFAIGLAAVLPSLLVQRLRLTAGIVAGCLLVVVGVLVAGSICWGCFGAESAGGARVSEVFGVFSTRKGRRTLLVLVLIYVAVALPFRSLEFLPGLTDIRPVCMLMPVYGLFYGPVGAWAFGLGNLIGDVAAHDLTWASVGGLLANFAAVYVYHVLWNRLSGRG